VLAGLQEGDGLGGVEGVGVPITTASTAGSVARARQSVVVLAMP
jgi:hypothetical protein